jgi:hypothetical protein
MSFNQLISVNNGAPNGSRNRQWSNSIINGLFYRFKIVYNGIRPIWDI